MSTTARFSAFVTPDHSPSPVPVPLQRRVLALLTALAVLLGVCVATSTQASADAPSWTAQTAAEANSWRSVTYGNGTFVAVSTDGTNRVMTSVDGVTWTAQSAAEANTWYSVTYGNGTFVAVSTDGTNRVMTSVDGVTWTAQTAAEANSWYSVTYGNGTFVAVAGDGSHRVMTSADGVTWTARTAAAANSWRSVTYGNGTFVAVASGGTNRVMTSGDGVTWTAQTAAAANTWISVTYGNGTFVAVALFPFGGPQVMTSADGVTWTARTAAAANFWWSVTYGNGTFVAVSTGGTNRVMTSVDGVTWTAQSAAAANSWYSVTYGSGKFVAVAADGASRVMTLESASAPAAPTSLVATPGDGSVSVAFTAGSDGGASISNYKYSTDDGSSWSVFSPSVTSSPVSITGLTNGTTYKVKLKAVNSVGDGAASDAVSVTPRTVPSAPTSLTATPGDGSVSVAFTAGSDGGALILNYKYSTDDGSTWTAFDPAVTSSPVSITGLTNGTTYKVKLLAVNTAGDGAASDAVSVTPRAVPSAPNSLVATPGDGSVSVAFSAGSDGGASISNYEYELNGSGSWFPFSPAVTTSPATISVTNGVAYTVKLRAVNVAGSGTASSASGSFTPRTTPSAPTSLVGYRGYGSAEVSFTAGADGGSAITNYKYSTDNGATWTALSPAVTSSPVTISGLTNGTTYSIKLRAVNAAGDGAISDPVSVTPAVVDAASWTARTAAEANAWYSMTYGNGLFVAVAGSGSHRVMTSTDGVTWAARDATEANQWLSVTYGNGTFVAVAVDGLHQVMTSPDGFTWTARDAAGASTWYSVTYAKGTFVAVAGSGSHRVMTSPDGVTWTAQAEAEPNEWKSVTYGNGTFVAVAAGGTHRVMTSADGVTWTAQTEAEANIWRSVTYGHGLFVAVAGDGVHGVMTSADGETWTARTATEANNFYSVTYGNGLFVAVSTTGSHRVMTSVDGVIWTARDAAEANKWRSVTYTNGKFVAVAADGSHRVMTSSFASVGAAPSSLVATPGDGSVSVAFSAGSDGGASISNYKYSTDDGSTWTAFSPAVTSSPVSITGLTNGTTYKVKLLAVNTVGDGAASDAVSVTPRAVPSAPSSLVATPGDGSVSVAFTSGSDGGASISNYKYSTDDGASWSAFSTAVTSSPVSITGLTNSTTYKVKLLAVNTAGDGAASDAVSVTPRTTPSAPTSVVVWPGGGGLYVTFTAGSDGGSEITKYQYSTDGGTTWRDALFPMSPIIIGGLTNGTSYDVVLRAVNAAGEGTATSSISATPRTTPSAPTSLVATPGDGSASVAFTAGSDGGSAITKYQFSTDGGTNWTDAVGTTSPVTIPSLSNYTTYSLTLRAVNIVGRGAVSAAPVSVTPSATGPAKCQSTALGKYAIRACWTSLSPAQGKVVQYRATVFATGTRTVVAMCSGATSDTSCVIKRDGRLASATTYDVFVRARVRYAGQVFLSLYSEVSHVTTQ